MWLNNQLTKDEKAINLVKRRARAVYQAQKKRGEHDKDLYSSEMAKQYNFGLELRPVDNPMEFKKEFYDQLRKEYAVRYLEAMGANATPATIRMVEKNLPMKTKMISAAWKSRGGLDDRLYIQPHEDKRLKNMRRRKGNSRVATAPSSTQSKGLNGTDSPLKNNRQTKAKRRPRTTQNTSSKNNSGGGGLMLDVGGLPVVNMFDVEPVVDPKEVAYEIMKRKYIFPYNTPSNPKFSRPLPDLDEAYRKSGIGGGDDSNKNNQKTNESNNNNNNNNNNQSLSEKRDRHNMYVELSEPLSITMKAISAQQKRFTAAFPFHKMKGKINKQGLQEISDFLVSSLTRKLIGLTAHYLYWTEFRRLTGLQSAGYSKLPIAKLRELIAGLNETWKRIETHAKTSSQGVLFLLPILLLSVRSAIETIFTQAYSLWFVFENTLKETLRSGSNIQDEGVEWIKYAFSDVNLGPLGPTLTMLNGRIGELFDPKRYYGRISALESTAEGIRILEKASRCKSTPKLPIVPLTLGLDQRKILKRFQKYNMKLKASKGGVNERTSLFYATSNRINALIPKPNTAMARKFMRKGRF